MGLVKTFALVAVSAGVGGYVGAKLYQAIDPKLPASVGPAVRTGAMLGFQAGTGVITFGVLRAMF